MRNIASECCNFQNSKAHAVFAKQTEAFYVLKFRRGYFLITRLKVKRKRACLRRVLLAAHEWSVSKNDNAWLAMTHCTLCQGYLFRFIHCHLSPGTPSAQSVPCCLYERAGNALEPLTIHGFSPSTHERGHCS